MLQKNHNFQKSGYYRSFVQKGIGVKYRILRYQVSPSSVDTTCLQARNSILYLVIFLIIYIHFIHFQYFQYNGYFFIQTIFNIHYYNFSSLYLYSYIRSYILNNNLYYLNKKTP